MCTSLYSSFLTCIGLVFRGVRGVIRCDFGTFLAPHFVIWFSQNHNRIVPYFFGHLCGAVYKMQFERFETSIFFKFWAFPVWPKTDFPFVLGQVLNY